MKYAFYVNTEFQFHVTADCPMNALKSAFFKLGIDPAVKPLYLGDDEPQETVYIGEHTYNKENRDEFWIIPGTALQSLF